MPDPARVVAPDTLARTLEYVNRLRVDAHFPPLDAMPDGEPGRPNSCPLYHALHEVWPDMKFAVYIHCARLLTRINNASEYSVVREIPWPHYVSSFVMQFDG